MHLIVELKRNKELNGDAFNSQAEISFYEYFSAKVILINTSAKVDPNYASRRIS